MENMNQLTVDSFATLLELAANNDVEGFTLLIERDPCCIDDVGLWYGRQKGSKQMVLDHRTPLMVASTYGSLDVLKLILSLSKADVNRPCGADKTTALHCAASGGSSNAADVVKRLLAAGADRNSTDANGLRPVDVILLVSPKLSDVRKTLEEILGPCDASVLTQSPENGFSVSESDVVSSPNTKREYPVDPSLPDIKNGIYSTDEFRMFSFKIRPCSRAYSHDWTECPFVHPGENARRRDPRKYHYSCVPCPDFRKGTCRRGDMCEYAHGVFECWLHPAQYRTRLCKDGTGCNRRVCFFAHAQEELRPLYVSTGSAVPSPRAAAGSPNTMDFAAAMSMMPPPMSPSANGGMNWPQPNVPALHLPGGGGSLQTSRLRSLVNARDMAADEDLNLQLLSEMTRQQRAAGLTPTKLEDLFSAEGSPRFSDQSVFSPRHNAAVFSQFQQQQSMLSPINTNFSPKTAAFAVQSPGRMSPRSLVEPISPMGSRVSMLARERHQFRSLSSRELGSNSAAAAALVGDSWSKWGEKPDWDESGKLRRSSSFENGGGNNGGEEPDLSWVQSLVKETTHETAAPAAAAAAASGASNSNSQAEQMDQSALNAWIEQMKLDHLVAQQN